jgi:hypothetical protein
LVAVELAVLKVRLALLVQILLLEPWFTLMAVVEVKLNTEPRRLVEPHQEVAQSMQVSQAVALAEVVRKVTNQMLM